MDSLELEWQEDQFNRYDVEWRTNLTRVVDALERWCKDSGIKTYGIGYSQIALFASFQEKRDAMLFKLRWQCA